ncbi:hypothetical protein [Pseudomonas sp. MWU13-3659]|uniref:hypothetical protein n=1 Tax=Pseudomonas sp. MWU13-3659 TaxID=2986964 RepID=UPI0020752689|nr:hypothetical protein [Pseudomonas sp. MWU13-3659]
MSKRGASRVSMLFSAITASIGAIINMIVKIIGRSPSSPPREDFPSVAASPLRLVVYPQGGKPEEGIVQNAPPFKLCHGAAHRLEVTSPDTSTWLEQKLSLHWDAGLPGEYGLSAEPPLKLVSTVQPDDEKHYQPLSAATGANWVLTARGGEAAQSGKDLELALGSYWQAPKYGFLADVGDFHYAVTTLEWDNVIPIVDPLVTSVLTATVKSPFDDARVMAGKPVWFELNGKRYQTPRETGEDGKARLTYTPRPEDIGVDNRVIFHAYCVDELGESSEKKELKIPAFASNAWPDELKVELRDEQGEPIDPTVLGVRLTRGGKFTLFVKPDAGSFFVDQPIKLVWPEGGAQLGIELVSPPGEPELGRPLPEAGLSWNLRGGGESGQFSLLVEIAALPMPFPLSGVQMSANLIDEVDVTIDGAALNSPLIFRRGQARTIKVQPKPGSPLAGLNWESEMSFLSSSQLPEDKVSSVPPFKEKRALTEQGLEWAVTGADASGTFGLNVHMDNFTGFTLRDAALLSQHLIDEVDVTIDGSAVSAPLIFRRSKARTLKLKPKPGSPLLQAGGTCDMTFVNGSLAPDTVTASPNYGNKRPMIAGGLEWSLTGANVSGTFGLDLHMTGFSGIQLRGAALLSQNLSDEVTLTCDGKEYSRFIFRRDKQYVLHCEPNPGSPLAMAQLPCKLTFSSDGTLPATKMPSVPAYGQARAMQADGLDWTLTSSKDTSGWFGLRVEMDGFTTMLDYPGSLLISDRLTDEAEVTADGEGRDRFVLRRGITRKLAVKPKPESPLSYRELVCSLRFITGSLSRDDVEAKPDYEAPRALTRAGLEWDLKGKAGTSGDCNFSVQFDGFDMTMPYAFVAVMAEFVSDEIDVMIDGKPVEQNLILRRENLYRLTLHAKGESPVLKVRPRFNLLFDRSGSLNEAQVSANPKYGADQVFSQSGMGWNLEPSTVSGTFGLKVEMEGFQYPLALPGLTVLSSRLEDEVNVYQPWANMGDHYVFYRGFISPLSVEVLPNSPLFKLRGLSFRLKLLEGGGFKEGDVPVTPAYGVPLDFSSGREGWTMYSVSEKRGSFGLEIHSELFDSPLRLTAALLSRNLADEVAYFPQEINSGGFKSVILEVKKDSPLLNSGVAAELNLVKVDPGGFVGCAPAFDSQRPLAEKMTWTVNAGSGRFSFEIRIKVQGVTNGIIIKGIKQG